MMDWIASSTRTRIAGMARLPGQVRVRTTAPWSSADLYTFIEKLTNAEVAVSPNGRVIAVRFDFEPEGVGSLSGSAKEIVAGALGGIKEADQIHYLDDRWLKAFDK